MVIGVLITVLMPYIFPVFADEKLLIHIKNQSQGELSALVEVTDLDLNRSKLKSIRDLQGVLPGQSATAELWLDGWAPESCSKIVIRSRGQEKSFDCGPREKVNDRFQTKADIIFRD